MSWTDRVHHSSRTPPLHHVQAAAENLADHAGIVHGKTRVVFGIVTDVVVLTSALIGGALGAVHLYKTLFPKHKEDNPRPEPAASDRSPPRRRTPYTATAFADRHDRHDETGYRAR